MRIFLRIAAVVAGIVVLLLIAVAIAVATIDVNAFVGPIQARVKQETGRDLAIRGGIDLEVSLEPKLVASDVTFGNADWGKAPSMVTAKRIEAQVKLLPLLQRRFDIVRFALIEPSFALESDGRGKRNWEFGRGQRGEQAPPPNAAGASVAALGIGNVEVEKGALTYSDAASGKTTGIAIDKLLLRARDSGSPVDAQFRGRVDDVPVSIAGTLGPLDALVQRRWPYAVKMDGEIAGRKTSIGTNLSVKDEIVTLDDLAVTFGASRATGTASVTTGGARSAVTFDIQSPALSVNDLPIPAPAADAKSLANAAAPPVAAAQQAPSFAALRDVDAKGNIAIERLLLREGRHVDAVRATIALRDGVLDVTSAQMSAFGGVIKGKVRIDATRDPDDALAVAIDARGLDLGALALAAGVPRDIKGGKTDVAIDVTMRGASRNQWLASASGTLFATVGPATLVNPKAKGPSALEELAAAVNPFRGVQQSTELRCAVARFPVRNGVAHVDRTIAFETRELGVAASGTLDFRNETLDLAVKPHLKQGIPIDLVQVASLVRVSGPFASPAVRVDKAATAETLAKLGAAFGAGGWGAVAGTLMKPSSGEANTCDVALGRAAKESAPSQEAAPKGGKSAVPADEITKALGKLFGGK